MCSRIFVPLASFVLLLLVVAGCPSAPDPVLTDSGPAMRVVPDSGPGTVVSRDGDVVLLSATTAVPATGEVLVSTKDGGLLRRVESTQVNDDGTITVQTSQATLADVVEDGDFTFTDGVPTAKSVVRAKSFEVFSMQSDLAHELYSADGATLSTSGSFSMDMNLNLDLSIRKHHVEYFASSVEGTVALNLSGTAELGVSQTFGTTGDGVSLLPKPFRKYIYGTIGLVPVVIEVTGNLYAGAEGHAGARCNFSTGASASSSIRCGAAYSAGAWSPIQDQAFTFTPQAPTLCIEGELGAKVFVKPVIEVQLYTVAGPKFDLAPYVELTGKGRSCLALGEVPSGDFQWELAAGLTGHAKVKADILDRYILESPALTLFDKRWPLLNSQGTTPAPTNHAPLVEAGAEETIQWPTATVVLGGTVRDSDGPGAATVTWSKVSGGGTVQFGSPNAAFTTVTFSGPDTYVLKLRAFDGQDYGEDTVTVYVLSSTDPLPFLTLPCGGPGIHISEGWTYNDGTPHNGIDYAAYGVTFPVLAAASGRAVASMDDLYGYFVYIAHDAKNASGQRYFTLYAHFDQAPAGIPFEAKETFRADVNAAMEKDAPGKTLAELFSSWTPVQRGQQLGTAGELGTNVQGIHLHFEVQQGGWANQKTDPYGRQGKQADYVTCGPASLWSACPLLAKPVFNPPSGTTFSTSADVSITPPTSGAAIRYTTNGSTPSGVSGTSYTGPIHLTATTTLKAVAYASGMTDSPVAQATFTLGATPPPLEGMALIPAGEFQMGDTFGEGGSDELPVHAVYVDAFYLDRTEVTNQQYAEALNWAYAQGGLITVTSGVVYKYNSGTSYPYCDTTTSSSYSRITWNGSAFGVTAGKEDHPMVMVSWYGAVAYANWRSGMQGKPLCYDLSTWECNWGSGYRLPTEAEWEKAARGGAAGHRFPWSDTDTIQHARANYRSYVNYAYDTSPTREYHPTFNTGTYPYTSPVGYFAPNGYGLYDMAGNAWEWCHDWYDGSYYGSSPYSNPHGAGTGNYRVLRGGAWGYGAVYLRCSFRNYYYPDYRNHSIGFRLALDAPSGQPGAIDFLPGKNVTYVEEQSAAPAVASPSIGIENTGGSDVAIANVKLYSKASGSAIPGEEPSCAMSPYGSTSFTFGPCSSVNYTLAPGQQAALKIRIPTYLPQLTSSGPYRVEISGTSNDAAVTANGTLFYNVGGVNPD
jgi:formylglycine-generating enzyme required for sulfatase activity